MADADTVTVKRPAQCVGQLDDGIAVLGGDVDEQGILEPPARVLPALSEGERVKVTEDLMNGGDAVMLIEPRIGGWGAEMDGEYGFHGGGPLGGNLSSEFKLKQAGVFSIALGGSIVF